jgi:glycosyltransferase involved in cell wall biosynthesis
MSKPTVALAMIVSAGDDSEALNLANCLGSVNGYVDEIFIQLNAPKGVSISQKVRQVAEQFTNKVFVSEWKNNFVQARNDIFKQVPKKYDWIIWLDSDDQVDNPENIIPALSVMPDDTQGVYILYDYLKDEFGNVIVSHWTTRAVRNNGSYAWKSSFDDDEVAVHETLIAKRGVRAVANNEWKVVHQATPEHHRESLIRNIELLEGMFERQSKKPEGVDPRILFYLGTHYYDGYNFKEAKNLFYEYLKRSGWAEERAEAHVYMGKLKMMEEDSAMARTAFLMALGEYPDNPGAYLELSKLEAKKQRWEQSATWAKRGLEIKNSITPMVKYNHEYDLLTLYAQALSNIGGKSLSEALKMAQKAYKLRPYDPDAKANRDQIEKLVDYRNNLRSVARLLRMLSKDGESKKILPLLNSLPEVLADSPLIVEARIQNTPAKKWPRKSMAIYVGHGPLGTWTPENLNKGGLGGSEEAVVRLTRELKELGWQITVFGTPGTQAGDFDGVEWKHYWEFSPKDKYDVLISWRQPGFFDLETKARKKYLWLHDVTEAEELIPERLKNLTKVIYVSKYHSERPENAHIKPSKKLPSGNGITPSDFTQYDGVSKRESKRCIYMSANERGLRILLDIWPDVKKAVPAATLDAYYGWQSFDAVNRDNPERMAWKATMVQRMKELPGVTERGRIGQDDLNKEIFKSGIFAYPSFFPEVNCITAQKAQAGGAWPVTSNFAALNDVVLYGDKIDMGKFEAEDIEKYKQALIHRLKNPPTEKERQEMMQKAREKFDWKNTAKQWSDEME